MQPSAEESKAERLKRQQARFRDRGGAFVPSNSNPLVDILLARTISGESPSKPRQKNVAPKRRQSSSKTRQSSPTAGTPILSEEDQPVAGCPKSKQPASRKRASKTVKPESDEVTKPTTKRRGRPAKKIPDLDVEEPSPSTKPTSKVKRKLRNNYTVPSTSDSTPKPKTKAKPHTAKKVVEVLFSDDDRTLVEAPRAKSNHQRCMPHEVNGETDEGVSPITERATLPVDRSKASNTKTAKRAKGRKLPGAARSMKKPLKDMGESIPGAGNAKTNVKKRPVLPEEEDEEVGAPPTKRGKAMKSQDAIEPIPVLRTTKGVETEEFPKAGGKRKGKGRPDPVVVVDGDVERLSKPKKRKKEEDSYEDRPRKVVKFVDTGPPPSLKLKENHSGRSRGSAAKTNVKDKVEPVHPKLTAKPPLRIKSLTSKGPPREVLERIKASATRYLRCMDSEPDELDCLS